jgi:hypothetical protein
MGADISLRGLTFAHSNWAMSSEGNSFYQAEVHLGGAISAVGARDIKLQNCTVKQAVFTLLCGVLEISAMCWKIVN